MTVPVSQGPNAAPCLVLRAPIGLISAVEKESGKLGKAVALITSAVAIGIARILPSSYGP